MTNTSTLQFQQSFHLRTSDIQDGISLLEQAKISGFVYPPEIGWATVVPEGGEIQSLLVENSSKLLFHLEYEDEIGWRFAIYQGTVCRCRYSCLWANEKLKVDSSQVNRDVLIQILLENQNATEEQLHKPLTTAVDKNELFLLDHTLDVEDIEDVDENPAHFYARMLGMGNEEEVLFDDLYSEYSERPAIFAQMYPSLKYVAGE